MQRKSERGDDGSCRRVIRGRIPLVVVKKKPLTSTNEASDEPNTAMERQGSCGGGREGRGRRLVDARHL